MEDYEFKHNVKDYKVGLRQGRVEVEVEVLGKAWRRQGAVRAKVQEKV